MIVAQHFSAGLAFSNASVPVGTIESRCHPPRVGRKRIFSAQIVARRKLASLMASSAASGFWLHQISAHQF